MRLVEEETKNQTKEIQLVTTYEQELQTSDTETGKIMMKTYPQR